MAHVVNPARKIITTGIGGFLNVLFLLSFKVLPRRRLSSKNNAKTLTLIVCHNIIITIHMIFPMNESRMKLI